MALLNAVLLASVSALALLAAGSAEAGQLSQALATASNSATAAAVAANQLSVAAAQAATLQSQKSLAQAAGALKTALAAQAAVRAAVPSSSFNGLGAGALDPVASPNSTSDGLTTWTGANLPTETVGNGQYDVTVNQTASKAILSWNSFNVGSNTTLTFDQQGNAKWVVLNRVVGAATSPSQILGGIKADGSVYVINQNGIVFGGGAQVNVHSLIASSLCPFSCNTATSNAWFSSGGLGDLDSSNVSTNSILLTTNSASVGAVTIAPGATITLSGSGGLALIAAPNVTNGGTIIAPDGQVALIAGIGVSYDYNYSSFNPYGPQGSAGQPQGTNDDSTTMLRFANYGQLTDANGSDITPVGTLVNNGIIYAQRGNITLLGGAIQQNGAAITTTSVQMPGSIVVTAAYEVGANGAKSPSDEYDTTFYTGAITFGPNAVTAILPDSNGVTMPSDATSLARFATLPEAFGFISALPTQGAGVIGIIGQSIDFQGGSLTYAPGQTLSANSVALTDPRVGAVAGSGRVLVESGAVLDVSGIPDVLLPLSDTLWTGSLGGNELADDPLQQSGYLYGKTVTVDLGLSGTNAETGESWAGTPLANLASYTALVQRPIGQALVNGGNIFLSGNEVDQATGSVINLMGGYVHYLGGMVKTTKLVDTYGHIVDISAADPNDTYVGLAGVTTLSHTKWGVTETFTNPLIAGGYYQSDYIVGGNAGTLTISNGGAMVLDATILASSVSGVRQVASDSLSSNGSLIVATILPIEIGDPGVLSAPSLAAQSLPDGFTMASPQLATTGSVYAAATVISSKMLTDADFKTITLTTSTVSATQPSLITEDAGTTVTVQPGGSINLTAGNVTINGTLTAKAGSISITTVPVYGGTSIDNGAPGDILIGPNAVLDVSGQFVNDRLLPSGLENGSVLVNGGSISLIADAGFTTAIVNYATVDTGDLTGNITLAAGSLLNLDGGGHVLPSGLLQTASSGVPAGIGGNLTIETYYGILTPPTTGTPTRGILTLDGAIDALGFSSGGVLTLQTVAMQVGGSAATTPSYAFTFDPTHWGNLGFGSFTLSTVLQAEVPAGASVILHHLNLLPDYPAISGAAGDIDPLTVSSVGSLTGTWLSPTNLSITAGLEESANYNALAPAGADYVQIDAGAQILADPGASISIDSYTMTNIFGSIRAPGGSIALSVTYKAAGDGGPMGPLYVGPNSVLDVSGTTEVTPAVMPISTVNGLVTPYTGKILAGGSITLTDDWTSILVAPGAVLNVSGAAGAFDVEQVARGFLGSTGVTVTRQAVWSDAGTVAIKGNTGLLFEGTLIGQPGAAQASGGTLDVTVDTGIANRDVLILVQNTAAALTATGASFNFATYVPGTVAYGLWVNDPKIPISTMVLGVDSLTGSGFSSLALRDLEGMISYSGKVALTLGNSFTATAEGFSAYAAGNLDNSVMPVVNGVRVTGGASLSVAAPYIELAGLGEASGGGFPTLSVLAGGTGDATMTLTATRQLDLSAFIALSNIGQATFISDGDIRLLPAAYAPTAGTQLAGYLYSGGNLTFEAADVYPATDTAFVIQAGNTTAATTTVTFAYPSGVAAATGTPLSANGTILVDAGTIIQNGEIQAPFGSIILGVAATDTTASSAIGAALGGYNDAIYISAVNTTGVTLGAGSVTSVSANGTVIPYGGTVDQTTWIYNPLLNNSSWDGGSAALTAPLTASPQGIITLTGNTVSFSGGAVINLSGGGDLQAQEWIAGTGGSRDVLSQYNTSYATSTSGTQVPLYADARQIFAILPGYGGAVAPYDANLSQSGLTAGQSVYLAGGDGLAAGVYTLLPAKYATLPGAYRVVVDSSSPAVLTPTTTLADNTMVMQGAFGNVLGNTTSSTTELFYVQSAATWAKYSQYALSSANSFFPSYAALNGLAATNIPADAGRLVIAATTGLVLAGTVQGTAAAGGTGAQLDISSNYIEIADSGAGSTSVANSLTFSAPGTSSIVLNGSTIDFTSALSGNDVFTVTGTGTLVVPEGATAALVIASGSSFTVTAQSVPLPSTDTLYARGNGTIAVSTTGIDTITFGNQTTLLPASSATTVTLPQTGDVIVYAGPATLSSKTPFVYGAQQNSLTNTATYSTTTNLYTATVGSGTYVAGTAANQKITWTTPSGPDNGTGYNLSRATGDYYFTATLATTRIDGGSSTYLVSFDDINALSSSDKLTGLYQLSGSSPLNFIYAPGSYSITSGQSIGAFSATSASPVTFTATGLDTIAYTSGSGAVTMPGSQAYLAVSAQQLDALGVTSLLIGGTRSLTPAGLLITPTANGVMVANDEHMPLTAPEIILAATPLFSPTTLKLDSEGASVAVATPIAGTGQVTFNSGSVVEALGPVSGSEPATLILGSTLSSLTPLSGAALVSNIANEESLISAYYTTLEAGLGTLVRLSNGSPVTVELPSLAQISPGTIAITDNSTTANTVYSVTLPSLYGSSGVTSAVIQPGAQLLGGNALTLVSTGDVRVGAGALLSGANITARSSFITFVGANATAPTSGMVIDPTTLAAIENATTLDLQSYGSISFLGDVSLAMAGSTASLTLGAATFAGGSGAQGTISAPTLLLDNEWGGTAAPPVTGTGSLSINAGELIFGTGAKALTGFGALSVSATQGIVGQGTGSFDFGALPFTLQTPILIADTASSQTLSTTGALSVLPGAGTALVSDALGGAIMLSGGSVTVSAPIQALAGNITLTAGTGDVTVTVGGSLIAHGVARQFVDVTEYADAGAIMLSATAGDVTVQSGAVIDFAGAAGGGNGGSLTLSAPSGVVTLNGTLLGATASGTTGSSFSLNSGGAVTLDALAQMLTSAGVTGSITIQTAQGDLALSRSLTASTVDLIANGGVVSVAGTIDASGTVGGAIALYGTGGATVDGTLLANATASGETGGSIQLGTSGTPSTVNGVVQLDPTSGYEAVATSGAIVIGPNAVLNVAGGGGGLGGTVILRAPLLSNGDVAVTVASPGAILGARAVYLDAYAVWSATDPTVNANSHFDGVVDPAGWYTSSGVLEAGKFYDAYGSLMATWNGTNSLTAAQLAADLATYYFTPTTANETHAVFYGGYNLATETFDPSNPDAGSLPSFIQNPGFTFASRFAGIANLVARPEIDLVNPANGPNSGAISVLTNWDLAAGVVNPDGTLTLAYRYQGTVAPVIALRAAGNFNIEASISDGFFQRSAFELPPGATYTYSSEDLLYLNEVGAITATTQVSYFDGTSGNISLVDPNYVLNPPLQGQDSLYYTNYDAYLGDYEYWAYLVVAFPEYSLYYEHVNIPSPPGQNNYSSHTAYLTAYQSWVNAAYASAPNPSGYQTYSSYLTAYDTWLSTSSGLINTTTGTMSATQTPPAPTPPSSPWNYVAYANYLANNYYNDLTSYVDANGAYQYAYAPIMPEASASYGTTALPAVTVNLPSNMPTATNPLPVQYGTLFSGQSASYIIVAGANPASANPLAVSATATLVGQGNLVLSGHSLYTDTDTYQTTPAPTTIRTGTGSIDIAAAGDIVFTDTVAPAVVYAAGEPAAGTTAGTNVDYVPVLTAVHDMDLILSGAVTPTGGGNISITAGGNITGIEQLYDTTGRVTGNTMTAYDTLGKGDYYGQFWVQWLLTNPDDPAVAWYVNFSSFDQGIMSVGGNVTVKAGGNIRDLAVSLPTTGYLDTSNSLHVTGCGNLLVAAGGNIDSGDFYVGQGSGTIKAGGAIASDVNYISVNDANDVYPVATLLAVQYGTIAVTARQSVDIGGVYDPTYLFAASMGTLPVPTYDSSDLIPYVTSMSTTSGVSIQATGGAVAFNTLLAQGDLFSGGVQTGESGRTDSYRPFKAAYITSLLLPSSLSLVAIDGGVTVDYGGGLYPSATGTLSIIADQSVALTDSLLTGLDPHSSTPIVSGTPYFSDVGNVFGTTLGKLDYLVGTGILPTASDPTLLPPSAVANLAPADSIDPALVAAEEVSSVAPVRIYSLTGSIIDGIQTTASQGTIWELVGPSGSIIDRKVEVNTGGTVAQLSLIPNAPAQLYAGVDILDLPFYGENFTTSEVTSLIAGRDIRTNIYGDGQEPAIELAGPGSLLVQAGRDISFPPQPNTTTAAASGWYETGIRTLGNQIDTSAYPIDGSGATANTSIYPYDTTTALADFGNPYLPAGGASVSVKFGVGPGIDTQAFIAAYLNPATASSATALSAQNWAAFQALSAAQQLLVVDQIFFDILNTTGLDENDPASSSYHQYTAGYLAINTLFPAAYGYTENALTGGTNGANALVSTGTLDMRSSTIQTQQGGNITIMGPGGRILVGSEAAEPAVDPASQGILTLESGNIDIFTDTDVLVAQSRIMTEQGGGIVMWSSNGNIDAGKGYKTSVSFPPPLFDCDIPYYCTDDIKGVVSGAGIATLQSLSNSPIGNANLMAPRGTVNAGAAGIRVSGNLNIAALYVANAFNIQVQGVTTGVPMAAMPNLGALTAASNTAGADAAAADAASRNSRQTGPRQTDLPSIITIEVIGYGGGEGPQGEQDKRREEERRRKIRDQQSYDMNSAYQVLAAGNLTEEQVQALIEERRKLKK